MKSEVLDVRVEHVRSHRPDDDVCDAVEASTDVDSLDNESAGGYLGHETEAHRADGELVCDRPREEKATCGPGRRGGVDE